MAYRTWKARYVALAAGAMIGAWATLAHAGEQRDVRVSMGKGDRITIEVDGGATLDQVIAAARHEAESVGRPLKSVTYSVPRKRRYDD